MCGISVIFNLNGKPVNQQLLLKMTELIRHRGPDDEGYCLLTTQRNEISFHKGKDTIPELQSALPALPINSDADLAFGFRRLSILDLSPKGHQPMRSADGKAVIVFNGEIYNYRELRTELEALGCEFDTHTDTEVILHAYQKWGADCLQRFIGMWAFALYDLNTHTLFCARDRYGIKPFYFYMDGISFYFGSELKQLLACPLPKELNYPMLWRSMKINALLAYGEETFFRHIKALRPGHFLTIQNDSMQIRAYAEWDISSFEQSRLSFTEAVEEYKSIFLESVKLQMRSDVEVGSCLSGGMDSSAIVCAAAGLTDKPFQTFSSYYGEDKTLDERQWIKLVAEQTHAVSHLVSPAPDKTVEWFEQATWHNDLPVGAGFVSQYAVMQLAKEKGVKVLLDGQGSDELTAGYNHAFYRYFADLLRQGKLHEMDRQMHHYFMGKPLLYVVGSLPKIILSALFSENMLYNIEFSFYRFEPFNAAFHTKVAVQLRNRRELLSEIRSLPVSRLSNFLYNMMHSTSIQTLLHYEDRMAMAHGVESRVPFMDHRLVQLAFSLPSAYKVNPPVGKYVHREAMKDIIPAAIYNRKDKAIFSTPSYSRWLKGPLAAYVTDVFNSTEFRQRGIYDLSVINRRWKAYKSGSKADGEMLFNILALEVWFRTFKPELT
jgi:asparagine synthase (glutamine-hydrolysing)